MVSDSWREPNGALRYSTPKLFTVACKSNESPAMAAIQQANGSGYVRPIVVKAEPSRHQPIMPEVA
jgi:hypothetical protein